jgi:hypothetical protein
MCILGGTYDPDALREGLQLFQGVFGHEGEDELRVGTGGTKQKLF